MIYAYTRKDAIEDGSQFKMDADIVKEAGFKYPIYITSSIQGIINRAVANKNCCGDLNGINWDIVSMLMFSIKKSNQTNDISFTVRINGAGRKKNFHLFAQIGPVDIDDASPAITIMFPEEI